MTTKADLFRDCILDELQSAVDHFCHKDDVEAFDEGGDHWEFILADGSVVRVAVDVDNSKARRAS